MFERQSLFGHITAPETPFLASESEGGTPTAHQACPRQADTIMSTPECNAMNAFKKRPAEDVLPYPSEMIHFIENVKTLKKTQNCWQEIGQAEGSSGGRLWWQDFHTTFMMDLLISYQHLLLKTWSDNMP